MSDALYSGTTVKYVLSTAIAYAVGSIPFAYLAGRFLGGKDLGRAGSGNLGTSNVFHEVGRAAGVAVFFADCAKMGLVLLALRLLGFSLWGQVLAALAVIAGHNWSVFTGFRGGRGMTVTLVGAAILLPRETLIVLGVLAYGGATGMIAPACGMALLVWPMAALWLSEPASLVAFALGAAVLGFTRRLEGSPRVAAVPRGQARAVDLLVNRLVFDREVPGPGVGSPPS